MTTEKGTLALLIHGGTENWSPARWKQRFNEVCGDRRVWLVTEDGGDPTPHSVKLLDFGLAKLVDQPDGRNSLMTRAGALAVGLGSQEAVRRSWESRAQASGRDQDTLDHV